MVDEARLVTRGRKYGQVLEGARRVFMRDGFAGASVDDIAREAAVSKATLYSYFSDKKLMFDAVFRDELERGRLDGKTLFGLDLPVDQVLRFTGHLIANHAVSEFGSRTLRLAIAEAERFPSLSAEYY
ncbi:MAG: TetR/AcrR family transcriptional regulator [Paracoccus sp. (in: a-proteobacteria)]